MKLIAKLACGLFFQAVAFVPTGALLVGLSFNPAHQVLSTIVLVSCICLGGIIGWFGWKVAGSIK